MPTRLPDPALTVEFDFTRPDWAFAGSTHALGQAFVGGELLRAHEIARRLDAIDDRSAWIDAIGNLNGSFAVVAHRGADVRAAVDRLRSIPLFYRSTGTTLRISDAASRLIGHVETKSLIPQSRLEFEFAGYVTGEETLIPGLRQIRAGHALQSAGAPSPESRQVRYYEFRHRHFHDVPEDILISRLANVHERVFRRLLEDIGDRQVVLPLSGGYDSRLIAHCLRQLGARNVLCYTYGRPDNWESRISRELAQHLGFEWVMVPYSVEQWRKVAKDPKFEAYFIDAANFTSLAHVQDWPAVETLVSEGRIAPNSVFVPGHTGDFVTGGHVPKRFAGRARVRHDELLQALFDAHYMLWDWPRNAAVDMRRVLTDRIERVIGPLPDGDVELAADAFECWEWQERQAKFIVNSVRVYEYFGFEWRLPLFDAELMDFWSGVRVEGRLRRRLYVDFVRRHQKLSVTEANTDRGQLLAMAVRLLDAGGLRPFAAQLRRRLRKFAWRRQYDHDDLAWFALVDRDEFRRRYTGRENGHAFFVLKYLEALNARVR